ncbi:hypothetical protein CHS0354_001945 [Potamilus streckersoni]|uniref:Adenine DNA glycosylase n=1 Tax=Potamilus streckersoni TaxID=2493646 RepID=A0AAE0W6P2_9BIVA|nr:hypothetical protein CHS0354_001945 [Potamilus streckersoni]
MTATLREKFTALRKQAGPAYIVIKMGGNHINNDRIRTDIIQSLRLLKDTGFKPVVVHGGGNEISAELRERGIEPSFINGLRLTDEPTMRITEMLLSGFINKKLTAAFLKAGVPAVGISGRDGGLFKALPDNSLPVTVNNRTGQIETVDTRPAEAISSAGYVPVISPVSSDTEEEPLNVNADNAASALAQELKAYALFMLTDSGGVYNNQKRILSLLTLSDITRMQKTGEISGGMIPKTDNAAVSIRKGVGSVYICTGSGTEITDCMLGISQTEAVSRLLDWFETNKRRMPWRDDPNPYYVWVSEIMLQQTQALAEADRDELMKHWEGLGYYQRVRNMQETARRLVQEYGGKLPRTRAELIKLKGIGNYVSASLASIAFGEDCACVDGNVLRVVSRLHGIREDISSPLVKKQITVHCEAMLPEGRAGDFNQAMMELGATVCKKQLPKCAECPFRELCTAHRQNLTAVIPYKAKKAPVPHYTIAVGVLLDDNNHTLIGLRKPDALLGNLWEFPGGKVQPGEEPADACKREMKEETGLDTEVRQLLCSVNHAYTHFKITLHACVCHPLTPMRNAAAKSAVELRIMPVSDLVNYAFPGANQPVLKSLHLYLSAPQYPIPT